LRAAALLLAASLAACTTAPRVIPGEWNATGAAFARADAICVGRVNALLIGVTNANRPHPQTLDSVYLGCMAELGLFFTPY
jgi:hypothetical protein